MFRKYNIKICALVICITMFNYIHAATLTATDSIEVGEEVTVTLNFGTYVGAYDSLQVIYNSNVLEYVSGGALSENLWWDTSSSSTGILKKTYTFKGLKDGVSTIKVIVKGAVSANSTLDELGDIVVSTTVSVGSGYEKGDLNQDGKINAEDAAMILDIYKNNNATEEDLLIGDMNEDGRLNAEDAAMILDVYKNS